MGMVPMLPQLPPTLMLPMLPQSLLMPELTSSARDLLTPMLKPSHGWPTLTTDAGYPYASTYGAYAAPVAAYGHAAYTTPYATYGAHLIGKRSADSEPESWYGAYGYASPYTTYGGYAAYRPYTYGRGVYGRYGYGW